MALSNGDGTFRSNIGGGFGSHHAEPRWQVGDFDGDGRDDLQSTWCALLVDPDRVLDSPDLGLDFDPAGYGGQIPLQFGGWACAPGVGVLTGHFDHGPTADLVLIGGPVLDHLAMAFFPASRFADFVVTNEAIGEFAEWAADPTIEELVADFDGDGLSDIALLGKALRPALPVAFSNGDGTFRVTVEDTDMFPIWASGTGVRKLVGDYDNDGLADIALTGGTGWNTLPVAFSNGDGTFHVTNEYIGPFANWAAR